MTDQKYPQVTDEAQKLFWNKMWESAKNSTSTKIKAIVDPLKSKVDEHDGLLVGLFKQMTSSFGGMMRLDEKLKKK
jgi:hypothetical protein